MKRPQPATLLSLLALACAMTAIALQFAPFDEPVAQHADQTAPHPLAARSVTQIEPEKAVLQESDADALAAQGQRIAKLERQLAQFERIIRTSGLDAAAPYLTPPPGSNASVLAHIGEQYATRARFEERRKGMLERADEMHRRDRDTYGPDSYQAIADLYSRARPMRGNQSVEQRTEREAALNQLMREYPEAWSTSVAIAEQALDAAINRNIEGAERYYASLVATSPYSEVVTEQGINAIPTLQTYLARQYVEQGRYDEATTLLDTLSTQADSIILEPNEMGEPTAKSAQDIVMELRDQIAR